MVNLEDRWVTCLRKQTCYYGGWWDFNGLNDKNTRWSRAVVHQGPTNVILRLQTPRESVCSVSFSLISSACVGEASNTFNFGNASTSCKNSARQRLTGRWNLWLYWRGWVRSLAFTSPAWPDSPHESWDLICQRLVLGFWIMDTDGCQRFLCQELFFVCCSFHLLTNRRPVFLSREGDM